MNSIFALLFLIFICVASLIVVSWANHVDAKKRLAKSRVRVLKSQFEELQLVIATVDQTVEQREVSRLLNQAALEIAQTMKELAPEDGYVISALKNTLALHEELQQETHSTRIYRIRESDSQIALARSHLDKAVVVLAQQQATGLISPDEFNTLKLSLAWAHLMLPTLTYVAQGHQAVNRNERLPAKAFYQKAKAAVVHSAHPDSRKNRLKQELSELVNSERRTLSSDLMLENNFNPQEEDPTPNGPSEQQERATDESLNAAP